jgi:superfamily II DNA or RNA helicase
MGYLMYLKCFLVKLHKMERDTEDKVLVKCIEYVSDDKEYEEVIYDYRGNPQYSSMITKICDYNHRTEFIIRVLVDELKENPNQQIMILGQNKSILKYIYDAIKHRNISTVGYYVGGMKELELKSSETKTVVVATYAMAAEGLDIKTLRTLFLATPRTDITQAVGRILRVKHDRPMVVDFVDTHQMFKNQQKKRLTFYRKNNYTIMETNSKRYLKNDWDNISTRRGKKSTKNSKPETPRKCLVNL